MSYYIYIHVYIYIYVYVSIYIYTNDGQQRPGHINKGPMRAMYGTLDVYFQIHGQCQQGLEWSYQIFRTWLVTLEVSINGGIPK